MIRALQFLWTTLDQTFGSLDTLKILLSPIRTYATKLIMGIDKEKTHLLWWALRMCSVAVRLAPPIDKSCSKSVPFNELCSY